MFTSETDCTYFFTWETKYACVGENEALPCIVADQRKRYDLARLIRHSGTTIWNFFLKDMHCIYLDALSFVSQMLWQILRF